jgi:hypothetical protein
LQADALARRVLLAFFVAAELILIGSQRDERQPKQPKLRRLVAANIR